MPIKQGQAGVRQEMHKFKEGDLHSGSASGPVVKNRKQAIAIAMHQAGMARKNPGSVANRGGSTPHGGFTTLNIGQARQRTAQIGSEKWQGGPPSVGYTHLGRFATGKSRPEATKFQ